MQWLSLMEMVVEWSLCQFPLSIPSVPLTSRALCTAVLMSPDTQLYEVFIDTCILTYSFVLKYPVNDFIKYSSFLGCFVGLAQRTR